MPHRPFLLAVLGLGALACSQAVAPNADTAAAQTAAYAQGFGPNPTLPEPRHTLLPTARTARPIGWAADQAPTAPAGFAVNRFAEGLGHPRWMHVLPNGDVLVAEASTEPTRGGGVEGAVQNHIQAHAGALAANANRITLLRDVDGDGRAEIRTTFLSGLNQPFGMALVGDALFIANTDAILRYRYTPGATQVNGPGERILALPYRAEGNGHWTRDLIASPDGRKLYVTVGSTSNVADNGLPAETRRANVLELNLDGSGERIYAAGLRNPNGLSWQPRSGQLWVAVNERDELGDELVPDYMTHLEDGAFYGWPFSYWGAHVDTRIPERDRRPDLVASARMPDYGLGAHTASLGLTFYTGETFPARYRGGAFIGQHGSWNRSEFAGYKVIFVPFGESGQPIGPPEDFLTGFLAPRDEAHGRPVGVAIDRGGALLVADDVGDIIWRVSPRR